MAAHLPAPTLPVTSFRSAPSGQLAGLPCGQAGRRAGGQAGRRAGGQVQAGRRAGGRASGHIAGRAVWDATRRGNYRAACLLPLHLSLLASSFFVIPERQVKHPTTDRCSSGGRRSPSTNTYAIIIRCTYGTMRSQLGPNARRRPRLSRPCGCSGSRAPPPGEGIRSRHAARQYSRPLWTSADFVEHKCMSNWLEQQTRWWVEDCPLASCLEATADLHAKQVGSSAWTLATFSWTWRGPQLYNSPQQEQHTHTYIKVFMKLMMTTTSAITHI